MAHADDIGKYEGPPCEICRVSQFVGTCTHRPRKYPEYKFPENLTEDLSIGLAVELERVKFRALLDGIKADVLRFHDGAFRMGMEQAIEEVEARIDEEWELDVPTD